MYKALFAALLFSLTAHTQAAVVAIMGTGLSSSAAIEKFLTSNGHTVVYNEAAAPGAASLKGVDAVIALRTDGNDDLKNFVLNGGLLITEWTAALWAVNTAQLIEAHAGDRIEIPNSTVMLTDAGKALGLGARDMPEIYSDLGRSDVIRPFTGLGEGVEVLSALPSGEAAIISGTAGSGYVIASSLDWADYFSSANYATRTWLLNALDVKWNTPANGTIPEPATLLLLSLGCCAFLLSRRYHDKTRHPVSQHIPLHATLLASPFSHHQG